MDSDHFLFEAGSEGASVFERVLEPPGTFADVDALSAWCDAVQSGIDPALPGLDSALEVARKGVERDRSEWTAAVLELTERALRYAPDQLRRRRRLAPRLERARAEQLGRLLSACFARANAPEAPPGRALGIYFLIKAAAACDMRAIAGLWRGDPIHAYVGAALHQADSAPSSRTSRDLGPAHDAMAVYLEQAEPESAETLSEAVLAYRASGPTPSKRPVRQRVSLILIMTIVSAVAATGVFLKMGHSFDTAFQSKPIERPE